MVWNGDFSSNVTGVSVQWKWGAAVYTHFTTDYNALNFMASHQNACGMNNSDHAGTPEGTDTSTGQPFKGFVIVGARGGGGSNFTGSWTGPKPSTSVPKPTSRTTFCFSQKPQKAGALELVTAATSPADP